MTVFAKIISALFHPLFMPFLGLLMLMSLDTGFAKEFSPIMYYETKRAILLIIVAPLTILFPLAFITMLKLGKNISSFSIPDRKERIPVFIGTLVFYITGYLALRWKVTDAMAPIYFSVYLGGIISVFLALLITTKWKISIHAIGIAGILGMLCAVNEILASYSFIIPMNEVVGSIIIRVMILMGIVCSARLVLKVHSIGQIVAGMALGFFVMYSAVKFGWMI